MQSLWAKNTSFKRTSKYVQMLFLGWNVCYASNVFILVSGSVGFYSGTLVCSSFYYSYCFDSLHPCDT